MKLEASQVGRQLMIGDLEPTSEEVVERGALVGNPIGFDLGHEALLGLHGQIPGRMSLLQVALAACDRVLTCIYDGPEPALEDFDMSGRHDREGRPDTPGIPQRIPCFRTSGSHTARNTSVELVFLWSRLGESNPGPTHYERGALTLERA